MKVLEVKNNLVKISYTAQDNLVISGFVIIEDSQYAYVAQIMSLKADSGLNYAIVKLLFTFNDEGVVKNYNGSVPELDSNITTLSSDELLDILPIETPLTIGKLAQQKFILNIDFSVLEKNLLICSDNTENTDILFSNIAKQLTANNCKSIIFDTTATIKAENRLTLGADFKLPLNYDTINFIYEHDLSDIDSSSKAIIQDILIEVQEYANTLIDKFIPFDLFINVIDSQYKQTQMPELALLKSRLIRYKDENIFAQEAKEFQSFRAAIRGNLSTLIDMSNVDSALQKLVISYAYDEIDSSDLFVYSLVKINNDNSDKKLMKKLITQNKVFTTIVCPHNYKYIHELKEVAGNLILFTPLTVQHDFASYNVFLNKLNSDEMIVYGKSTQNIPLILELLPYEDLERLAEEYNENKNNTDALTGQESDSFNEESNTYSQESMINDTPENQEIESKYDISEPQQESGNTDYEQNMYEKNPEQEVYEANDQEEAEGQQYPEEINETPEQKVYEEEQQIEPEIAEASEYIQEEAPETYPEETSQEEQFSEEYNEQISEQQDFITEENYTESYDNNMQEEEQIAENNPETPLEQEFVNSEENTVMQEDMPEDELTEQDLDYIDTNPQINTENNYTENQEQQNFSDDMDEFSNAEGATSLQNNGDFEEQGLAEGEYLEDNLNLEEYENTGEPAGVVPIYPAEDDTPITTDIPQFESGDKVSHPKYGEGVVEKMVKFGNKVLCSINFANGRRLLDPTISQIERL